MELIKECKFTLTKKPVKSAIVSLLNNISFSNRTYTGKYDKYFLREMLLDKYGRICCDIVGTKTKQNTQFDFYIDIKDFDLNYYDEIWLSTDIPEAYGGKFQTHFKYTFEKISTYNGKIYFFELDPLFMPNTYYIFLNRKLKLIYDNFNTDAIMINKTLYPIDENKIRVFSDKLNNALTAFNGVDYMKLYLPRYKKPTSLLNLPLKNNTVYWCELPLMQYYGIKDSYKEKMTDYPFENRKYDFVYYGRNRSNRRKHLKQYLDRNSYYNYVIQESQQWTKCKFDTNLKYINHSELFEELAKAYATIVIEDKKHNNNILTARFCETMMADVVAFIDINYDTNKNLVKNEFLKNFIYVSSPEELEEKFNKIKKDKNLFNKIVNLERQEIHQLYKDTFNED